MQLTTSTLLTRALLAVMAVLPMHASTIPVSYSLTGTGTVVDSTATTLTLEASSAGSLVSGNPTLDAAWNPVTYTDLSVLDFNTNLLNGNFTISLADGDTLFGTVFEDQTVPDNSATGTGAFPQTLTILGGTGAFTGVTGSLSGEGFLGTTDFTVSGSGSINTSPAPEPGSAALFLGGLTLLIAGAWRRIGKARCWNRLPLSVRV